jgi:hypothetical protein
VVEVEGIRHAGEHIVVATGSDPMVPPIKMASAQVRDAISGLVVLAFDPAPCNGGTSHSLGGVPGCTVAHQAAISARRAAPSLVRRCAICAEILLGASTSRSAICRLARPAAASCATSNSRALSGYYGSADRPTVERLGDLVGGIDQGGGTRRGRNRADFAEEPGRFAEATCLGSGGCEVKLRPRSLPEPAPSPPRIAR